MQIPALRGAIPSAFGNFGELAEAVHEGKLERQGLAISKEGYGFGLVVVCVHHDVFT